MVLQHPLELSEHTENTEKGCTKASDKAVRRFHEKQKNIRRTQQRGIQDIQYQRYSIIQIVGSEHTKTRERRAQMTQEQRCTESKGNSRI